MFNKMVTLMEELKFDYVMAKFVSPDGPAWTILYVADRAILVVWNNNNTIYEISRYGEFFCTANLYNVYEWCCDYTNFDRLNTTTFKRLKADLSGT